MLPTCTEKCRRRRRRRRKTKLSSKACTHIELKWNNRLNNNVDALHAVDCLTVNYNSRELWTRTNAPSIRIICIYTHVLAHRDSFISHTPDVQKGARSSQHFLLLLLLFICSIHISRADGVLYCLDIKCMALLVFISPFFPLHLCFLSNSLVSIAYEWKKKERVCVCVYWRTAIAN